MNENIEKESNKLFKQRLQRVHVATGISFSLLMYVAVFFGIFAILLPYIQVWEKPSRHYQIADITCKKRMNLATNNGNTWSDKTVLFGH